MKIFLLTLSLLCFRAHAQNNLFRNNPDKFADFGYTKQEISELKSQGTLSIFNKEKHNSSLAAKLFKTKEGGSITLNRAKKKKLTVIKRTEV